MRPVLIIEISKLSRVYLLIILACYLQVGVLFPTPNVLTNRLVFRRKTYWTPVKIGVRSKYNSTHHVHLRYFY